MNYRLASLLLKHHWLIDERFAAASGQLVANILSGNIEVERDTIQKPSMLAGKPGGEDIFMVRDYDKAPQGSVAIIDIKNELFKDDQWCGPEGMASIGERIKKADRHPNIGSILLRIDSPGGTVDGTETLANQVKNTKKPILTFVDGLMTSAAMWIGSSADKIIASKEHDEVGSIGVILSFADLQPAWEAQGVVFHRIVSNLSPDKIKWFEDLRAGKYDDYKKSVLDPLAAKFQDIMRQNRPAIQDEQMTGKVYFASEVLGTLVDEIGSFERAVEKAAEMGNSYRKQQQTQANSKTEDMKNFALINKTLGVDSLEAQDEGVFLNEDQLGLIEKALAPNDELSGNVETLTRERDQARGSLEESEKRISELEGQVEKLSEELAEKPASSTSAPGKKEDEIDEDPDGVDWKAIDSLRHNQEADQLTVIGGQ